MSNVYAIVEGNTVINTIILNNPNDYPVDEPYVLMEANSNVSIHDIWTGVNFLKPKPYPSWTIVDHQWTPPVPMPDDGNEYTWDEANQEWDLIVPEPANTQPMSIS